MAIYFPCHEIRKFEVKYENKLNLPRSDVTIFANDIIIMIIMTMTSLMNIYLILHK